MAKTQATRNRCGNVRLIVAAIIVISLSGCTSPDELIDEGRLVIAEDQYYRTTFQLNYDVELTISVEVNSGPSVDVIVMDELNFQQFESGNDYIHYPACGGVAAQGFTRTCNLNEGIYVVVLDNTDAGNAAPPFNGVDDGADVSWKISAW